jgi:hypothetical protein
MRATFDDAGSGGRAQPAKPTHGRFCRRVNKFKSPTRDNGLSFHYRPICHAVLGRHKSVTTRDICHAERGLRLSLRAHLKARRSYLCVLSAPLPDSAGPEASSSGLTTFASRATFQAAPRRSANSSKLAFGTPKKPSAATLHSAIIAESVDEKIRCDKPTGGPVAVADFFCSAASIEPVPPPRFSGARVGYSLFARGLRGDDLRFQRPNDGNGARRRRLRMQVNKVAQVQETCDARLVALVGVGDIDRFVQFEKRHSVRLAFLAFPRSDAASAGPSTLSDLFGCSTGRALRVFTPSPALKLRVQALEPIAARPVAIATAGPLPIPMKPLVCNGMIAPGPRSSIRGDSLIGVAIHPFIPPVTYLKIILQRHSNSYDCGMKG